MKRERRLFGKKMKPWSHKKALRSFVVIMKKSAKKLKKASVDPPPRA
jgi:hypothetical protein